MTLLLAIRSALSGFFKSSSMRAGRSEKSLDFHVVLFRTERYEEIVVMLDILQLMRHDDGPTSLSVLKGCRVCATWILTISVSIVQQSRGVKETYLRHAQ